jgi:hypothetical protein
MILCGVSFHIPFYRLYRVPLASSGGSNIGSKWRIKLGVLQTSISHAGTTKIIFLIPRNLYLRKVYWREKAGSGVIFTNIYS